MHFFRKIPHKAFLLNLLVLLILLAKNPFSIRTLIPNFEPYPDTIHYLNPAISFVQGHGLQIYREGRPLQTNVPPLYSIFLSLFFVLIPDARMFYFTNVLLSIGSFVFFYLVINKLSKNGLLIFLALFLYVTNYFIYWYPTLAMAENLTLFLFMLGIYLLTFPVTLYSIVLAGIISVAFYATKYASLPLTFIFFLSYMAKIMGETSVKHQDKGKANKAIGGIVLFFTTLAVFLLYSFWEWRTKGATLLVSFLASLYAFFSVPKTVIPSGTSSGDWFSFEYVKTNLPTYLRALLGGYPVRFLWDNTPIVSFYTGTIGVSGLLIGMFKKQFRFISVLLILMLTASILFMSLFYAIDMRYLYHIIPIILIGFVIFWTQLSDNLNTKVQTPKVKSKAKYINIGRIILKIGLLSLFAFYALTNLVRLKSQIGINLRYSETPWYYLSVIKLNDFFKNKPNKPYVITAMSPYYIDFFSNGRYRLLPVSTSQDFFRSGSRQVWGQADYSNLITHYHVMLDDKKEIYLLSYLGNDENVRKDLDTIKGTFNLTLISEGCYGSCNIWKVALK